MESAKFDKLVDGVELSDIETESLSAQKAALAAKIAQLSAALENASVALVSTDEALAKRADMPSVREMAFGIASSLEGCGCNDLAIRAAIVAQFGKKSLVVRNPSKPPTAGGTKEKKITLGLPSVVDQDSILTAVREAGAEGIRMETLYEKFPAVCPDGKTETDSDKSRLAVFGTVKNALLDNRVLTSGQARGMRYVWVDAPVAPPAAPAAE